MKIQNKNGIGTMVLLLVVAVAIGIMVFIYFYPALTEEQNEIFFKDEFGETFYDTSQNWYVLIEPEGETGWFTSKTYNLNLDNGETISLTDGVTYNVTVYTGIKYLNVGEPDTSFDYYEGMDVIIYIINEDSVDVEVI